MNVVTTALNEADPKSHKHHERTSLLKIVCFFLAFSRIGLFVVLLILFSSLTLQVRNTRYVNVF